MQQAVKTLSMLRGKLYRDYSSTGLWWGVHFFSEYTWRVVAFLEDSKLLSNDDL